MVLCRRHAHLVCTKRQETRASEQLIETATFDLEEAAMQVRPTARSFRRSQMRGSHLEIRRPHAEIDVTVRTQRAVWIETGGGPTFYQNRFNGSGAQQPKDCSDIFFMNAGLEQLQTVGLMQHFGRRSVTQLGALQAPPT